MAKEKFKIEGAAELADAFREVATRATQRNIVRRAGISAMTPMRDHARSMAPDDPSTPESIAETIIITTKAPKNVKSGRSAYGSARAAGASVAEAKSAARAAGATVNIYMGPNRDPKAVQQEFGNVNHGPQPFMRPALDANKGGIPRTIGGLLWDEIRKAAARAARKTARMAQR